VEVAHFVTCRTVAFVDADGVSVEIEVGWEGEFDLVLDCAAVT
jgi:hypothetical protein